MSISHSPLSFFLSSFFSFLSFLSPLTAGSGGKGRDEGGAELCQRELLRLQKRLLLFKLYTCKVCAGDFEPAEEGRAIGREENGRRKL